MPATPVGRLLARFAVRRMVGSSGPGITRHGTPCGDEREITSMENKMTERYISYIPRKLPTDGRVVVHNRVRPVVPACDCFPVEQHGRDMIGLGYTPAPGWEGFRLWIQTNSRSLCRCDCGCLPVPHYRERREDDPARAGRANNTPRNQSSLSLPASNSVRSWRARLWRLAMTDQRYWIAINDSSMRFHRAFG